MMRLALTALLVFLACSTLAPLSATATPNPRPVAFLSAAPLSCGGSSVTASTAAWSEVRVWRGYCHAALGLVGPTARAQSRPLHRRDARPVAAVVLGGVACSAGAGGGRGEMGGGGVEGEVVPAEGAGGELRGARVLPLPAFDRWMRDQGIEASGVAHASFSQGDGSKRRGVVALQPVKAGEPIVELPRDAALVLLHGEKCPPGEKGLEGFWASHPQWYVRIGLKLLLEREKGERSKMWGYIQLLPAQGEEGSLDFPVEWSPERLASLRYAAIERAVAHQQTRWEEIAREFAACAGGRFSEAELRWAFKVTDRSNFGTRQILSRYLRLPTPKLRVYMLPTPKIRVYMLF
ncbi:hypothetical protein T484DRAFT_2847879 [Baffinella frigidus]|nr:hypothetical protein T484DRAFT_2847879 [Cryptophyta sp. CCMP2293]